MRNKTVIICAAVCTALFIAAAIMVIYQYGGNDDGGIIITLDGKTIYEGAATHEGEPLYIDAVGGAGTNHIRIDERGVCVESADCPNGECVAMGYLKSRYLPVVCLPNRLVIQYSDVNASDEPDAVSK